MKNLFFNKPKLVGFQLLILQTMKTSFLLTLFFLIFLMLNFQLDGSAQVFQRNFGTTLDNSFSKVLKDGTDYYVLGQNEPSGGGLPRATVTRLDANGNHKATLELPIASVWNDAVLTAPGGALIVVGSTLPFDPTTKSLMGKVTYISGVLSFGCVQSYDEAGRDAFLRIVKNPNPESLLYPYYIVGTQNQPGGSPTEEDVVLLNVNDNCNFNWKKTISTTADDEWFRDLEAMPNGDLILAGNDNSKGIIFRTDNAGIVTTGVYYPTPAVVFADVSKNPSGTLVYASGNGFGGSGAHIMKFEADLSFVHWDVLIPELTTVRQIWEASPGIIYVVGTGNFGGANREVIIKLFDNPPFVVTLGWVKYLHAGSGYGGGSAWQTSPTELAFTDTRVLPNGFGGECAFISVSDLELNTCMVSNSTVTLTYITPIPEGPAFFPPTNFQGIPIGTDEPYHDLNWMEADVCPCTANFNFQNNGCGMFSFNGIATGFPPFVYSWNFGDPASGANNFSSLQNPTHLFASSGSYLVRLTIVDASGCTVMFTATVTVPSLPSVSISANPGLNFCQGQSTTLTASGGTGNTYLWSNSVGGQSITVSTAGNYCVTCTDVNGCTATDCVTVSENPSPTANAGPDQSICEGQTATLTATGGGTYVWSPGGATTATVSVNPNTTTTYTVTVTGNNGCTATDQVVVIVKPKPFVNAGPDQVICPGQSATLQATGSGGTPPYSYVWTPGSSNNNPYTVTPSSTTTYTVQVTDADGCTEVDNVTVSVNPIPNADAGIDQIICAGQSATLTASGGGTYVWTPGGATTPSITVSPGVTTVYTVAVSLNGCTATDQVTVTVNPLPLANAGPDKKVCLGQTSATLTASGGGTYVWTPGGATTPSITVSPGATTVYTVSVTLNGCTATDQATVTVNPLPIAIAGPDQTMCAGQSAILHASAIGGTPPYLYKWVPWWLNINPVTVSPGSNETYTVKVTDANGCTSSSSLDIDVVSCCQSSLVQNWDFSQGGTPLGYDFIWSATNWEGIWHIGPGSNHNGDYWGPSGATDPYFLLLPPSLNNFCFGDPPVPNPPSTGGNYAGFMCRFAGGITVGKHHRQGILNNLNGVISPNTGYYKVSMQIACPCIKFGSPKMVVYGVRSGANSTITPLCGFANGPYSIFPSNGNLFATGAVPCPIPGAGAKELGTIIVPNSKCDEYFETYSFVFNSANLSAPIDRIFLTRKDAPAGTTYLAIDDVCIESVDDSSGNNCHCGPIATGVIIQAGTGFSSPISCNNSANPIQLPCRKQGYYTYLAGNFPCNSSNCADTNNTVTWVLNGPTGTISGTSTGSILNSFYSYPNFVLQIPWSQFPLSGGSYTLTLTRMCGTQMCSCDMHFNVAACPCSCDANFYADVNQGFTAVAPTPIATCSKNLKPMALCPNDMVTWHVIGAGSFGPSFGNNTQTVAFPGPGSYQVCMLVKRTLPDGQECTTEACQTVNVSCGNDPNGTLYKACEFNMVSNGEFRDSGVVVGLLGDNGWMPDWDLALNYGDGYVIVEDNTGADDEGHLVFTGGKNNFAGIAQEVNLGVDSIINIAFSVKNYLGAGSPLGTRVEIRLQASPFPDSNYQVLLINELDTMGGWERKDFSLAITPDTSKKLLVICLQNEDPMQRSVIGLDNFEFCTSNTPPVGTEETQTSTAIDIFPNPTTGELNLQLNETSLKNGKLLVFDTWGRNVKTETLTDGIQEYTFSINSLPSGIYFIKILDEDVPIWVQKIIKQ